MKTVVKTAIAVIGLIVAAGTMPAHAAECEARVVGLRSLDQYNHLDGTGFLAVRTGPRASYRQIGEVYGGDRVAVIDRQGNWYHVACMSGVCLDPYWGDPQPSGWVSGRYLGGFTGLCP